MAFVRAAWNQIAGFCGFFYTINAPGNLLNLDLHYKKWAVLLCRAVKTDYVHFDNPLKHWKSQQSLVEISSCVNSAKLTDFVWVKLNKCYISLHTSKWKWKAVFWRGKTTWRRMHESESDIEIGPKVSIKTYKSAFPPDD